jgi:hypothetical protein
MVRVFAALSLAFLSACGYSTSQYRGDGSIRQVSSGFRTWEVELGRVEGGAAAFTAGGLPPYDLQLLLAVGEPQGWDAARTTGRLVCAARITDDLGHEVASWRATGQGLLLEEGVVRAHYLRFPSASFRADPSRTYKIEVTVRGAPEGPPPVATLYGGNRVTL